MFAVLAAEAEACHSLAALAGVPWKQDIVRTEWQCVEMQGSGLELRPALGEVVDVDVDVEQDSVDGQEHRGYYRSDKSSRETSRNLVLEVSLLYSWEIVRSLRRPRLAVLPITLLTLSERVTTSGLVHSAGTRLI